MNSVNSNIPNHMLWTILSTIIATLTCCPLGLLGIIGIVNSNKVNTLLAAGDAPGALRASNTAKTWAIVASVLAGIGILFSLWFYVGGGMQSYMEAMQAAQGA